jgi:hypothetical protein
MHHALAAAQRRPGRSRRDVPPSRRVEIDALLAIPALYLFAALIGSLVPVNRSWTEPKQGTIVYLADNGIHVDLIMPINAQGLDWAPLIPKRDFAHADPNAGWISFGSGEQRGEEAANPLAQFAFSTPPSHSDL